MFREEFFKKTFEEYHLLTGSVQTGKIRRYTAVPKTPESN